MDRVSAEGEARRLTTGGDAVFLGWGQGGETVRFGHTAERNGAGQVPVWEVPLAGGKAVRLAEQTSLSMGESPRSPDGRWEARVGSDGVSVRLSGEVEERRLSPQAGAAPVWSPDGTYLAFVGWDDPLAPCLRVWAAAEGRDRCLFPAEQGYLSRPDWSPEGESLVVSLVPAGSETAYLAEIWLVPVGGGAPARLTWDEEEQSEPRWSPEGKWLLFRREGDLWVMPVPGALEPPMSAAVPSPPAASPTPFATPGIPFQGATLAQKHPPATIRVIHRAENYYRPDVPPGRIDVLDFETYVRRVVPYEMPASWHPQALRAQAIAARTYAWQRVLTRQNEAWDVSDWVDTQVMGPRTYAPTDEAVLATQGQYVAYGGTVISAMYSAQNGSPTRKSESTPYLQAVDDPVCFREVRKGHGWGLSQVGAQRWASWYGWDDQQILMHYYTAVSGELPLGEWPDVRRPLGQLVSPWAGFYLRSAYAWLVANASDDLSGVSRVEFHARYGDGTGRVERLLGEDQDGSDGWNWLWDLRSLPPHALAAPLEVRVVAVDGVGNRQEDRGWVPLGLDWEAPAGQVMVTTPVVTGTAALLQVQGADAGPAGLLGVGVNNGWVWEGEDLPHWPGTGEATSDAQALNSVAWCAQAGVHAAGAWYGPYTFDLMPGQAYRAYFRLRTDDLSHSTILATLDVADQAGARLLGIRQVRGTDFRATNAYQDFYVDFEYPEGDLNGVELRTWYGGGGNLCLDRVEVTTYPQAPSGGQAFWPIWGDEGTRSGQARLADLAGNVSAGLPVTVTVVDESPPEGWSNFAPADWVSHTLSPPCWVRVQDPLSGLDVTSAAFQFSTDGGGTWGEWLPALLPSLPNPTWPHTITMASVAFGQDGLHWIRFRVADRGGRVGVSPDLPVRIDTTPPETTAKSPPVSETRSFTVTWSGADAVSGLAAYDVQYRDGAEGPWVNWLLATSVTQGLFVGEPGHTYYFRVRGRDLAGNVEPYTPTPFGDTATHVLRPVLPRRAFLPWAERERE